MDKAESDRIEKLCSLIALEQDQHKLLTLVEELNLILNAKNSRFQDKLAPKGD